jgi:hypothetical protein
LAEVGDSKASGRVDSDLILLLICSPVLAAFDLYDIRYMRIVDETISPGGHG